MTPDTPLPTGTVTFLFTDIEGSTRLWEAAPEAMRIALERHDALMREAIVGANGHIFKTAGDAFCAAFALASDAVAAAHAAQRAVGLEPWAAATPIKMRMALHTGAVELRDGDYFGPALNRVARLLPGGHGGQTLVSQITGELCRDKLPAGASLRDLGAHQLRDLARPEQVYELRHPDFPRNFPPIRSLSTHPNNLPRQLSSFIGRETAIADVGALLVNTRLLTLTGAGGCGKTRLGLQAAADSLEHFPDGAWLVELASLADPGLVPHAVAMVLGVAEERARPVTQSVIEHLTHKRLLLIFDNCEHLLDACARFADALVRQCHGIKLLATSREALGIHGEQAYRVPSLSLPDRKDTHTPEALYRFESVRLFVDRALLVRPEFQVNAHNARALASLCCHLDGIPLAIELAAARVRSLSVEEIDGKLDQRFRLLTGGSRTALPRQQTLRSLIDWSYDLLHKPEQVLLQRLAVFAGGWTLSAAEEICVGESVAEGEVLDRLTSLADKSLVAVEEIDRQTRYRLLETVRQYARDRLMESGGGEVVRERHRNHFLALAEEAEPKLLGAQQALWLQRLEEEHENLRAALDWSFVDAGSAMGLRLCGALQRFWFTRGYLTEGREWCARILDKAGGDAPTAERANTLNAAGLLAYHQGDVPAARALHEESLAIRRQLPNRSGVAISLNNLGMAALDQGDHTAARTLHQESLAISRELGRRNGIASSLGNLGLVALDERDFASAHALFMESLSIMRELGDRGGIAITLHQLGLVAGERGDPAAAFAMYAESLTILRELGHRARIAYSLEELAAVVAARGSASRAARIWGAAERLREEIGSPAAPEERSREGERAARARAALGDDAAFDRAWQEGRALTLEQAIELALDNFISNE